MMSEEQWKHLKATETYGMFVVLKKEMDILRTRLCIIEEEQNKLFKLIKGGENGRK